MQSSTGASVCKVSAPGICILLFKIVQNQQAATKTYNSVLKFKPTTARKPQSIFIHLSLIWAERYIMRFSWNGSREGQCLATECTGRGLGSGQGAETRLPGSQLPLHSAVRWNGAWQQRESDAVCGYAGGTAVCRHAHLVPWIVFKRTGCGGQM